MKIGTLGAHVWARLKLLAALLVAFLTFQPPPQRIRMDLQLHATESANIIVGLTSLTIDSADVGYTQDGVSLRQEREFLDIKGDQWLGTIKKFITDVTYFLTSTLKEVTLSNLVLVWEGSTSMGTVADDTLNLTTPSKTPAEHDLVFVGPAPDSGNSLVTRTLTAHKAVSIGNGEHTHSKTEETTYPVEYELIPDFSSSGDEYGSIVDSA